LMLTSSHGANGRSIEENSQITSRRYPQGFNSRSREGRQLYLRREHREKAWCLYKVLEDIRCSGIACLLLASALYWGW
jgi:hypothetical protein